MAWFRRKGKYWYFVMRKHDREKQYYIGDDKTVIKKLINYRINEAYGFHLTHKGKIHKNGFNLLPNQKD